MESIETAITDELKGLKNNDKKDNKAISVDLKKMNSIFNVLMISDTIKSLEKVTL